MDNQKNEKMPERKHHIILHNGLVYQFGLNEWTDIPYVVECYDTRSGQWAGFGSNTKPKKKLHKSLQWINLVMTNFSYDEDYIDKTTEHSWKSIVWAIS